MRPAGFRPAAIHMTIQETSHAFEHAVRALALDDALALVAAHCVNDGARRTVATLRPTSDAAAIRESLDEVGEYRTLREQSGDLAIPDTGYRADVERIARGERGSGEALRKIADGERAIDTLRRGLSGGETAFARLRAIAASTVAHPELVAEADRALEADGTVKDGASPALKAIRRDIRAARVGLRERAEKLVGDLGADSHATVMGTRHVLVVPRGKVKKGSGLVHGASQTGGSLYVEPVALLELNNALETRLADETEEVARILAALSDRVRRHASEILANADAIERLDGIRARAAFAERFGCVTPDISATGRLRLVRARHPLLTLALERAGALDRQVPLDLTLEPGQRLLVITGPNAGGKTVALKTVGLAGAPAAVRPADSVRARQRAAGLRAGVRGHRRRAVAGIVALHLHVAPAQPGRDEPARRRPHALPDRRDRRRHRPGRRRRDRHRHAGADARVEAAVIATTHYGRIKTFALETDGVANASMAFEDETARPLYRLLRGHRGAQPRHRHRAARRLRPGGGRARGVDPGRRSVPAGIGAGAPGRPRPMALERERAGGGARELERLAASNREKERAFSLTKKEATRKARARSRGVAGPDAARDRGASCGAARARRGSRHDPREPAARGEDARGRARKSAPETAVGSARERGRRRPRVAEPHRPAVGHRGGGRPQGRGGGHRRQAHPRAPRASSIAAAGEAPAAPRAPSSVEYEPVGEIEVTCAACDRESALEVVSRFIDRARAHRTPRGEDRARPRRADPGARHARGARARPAREIVPSRRPDGGRHGRHLRHAPLTACPFHSTSSSRCATAPTSSRSSGSTST